MLLRRRMPSGRHSGRAQPIWLFVGDAKNYIYQWLSYWQSNPPTDQGRMALTQLMEPARLRMGKLFMNSTVPSRRFDRDPTSGCRCRGIEYNCFSPSIVHHI